MPDTPLANLGKAMFYVAYAWMLKWYQDHGVYFGDRRYQQITNVFERITWTWSMAFVLEEGDPAFVRA